MYVLDQDDLCIVLTRWDVREALFFLGFFRSKALRFRLLSGSPGSAAGRTILLAVAAGNKGILAADTLFPTFACLIFFPEKLMPNGGVQLRPQGQDCRQEVITVHSTIMNGL